MVTTLSPNARDTPSRPIPTWGKPAAITALPHPANVSQNVPIASAAYFFASISPSLINFLSCRPPEKSPAGGSRLPKPGVFAGCSLANFHGFTGPKNLSHRWTLSLLSDTSARSRLRARLFRRPFVLPDFFRSPKKGCRVQVLVRDNNVDQALKALKKKMQREGIFREMKLRNYYEKPSEKRVREQAEAVRRARKLARKRAQREGLLPGKAVVKPGARPGGRPGSGPPRPGAGSGPPRSGGFGGGGGFGGPR